MTPTPSSREPDASKVAAGLTKAQQRAFLCLNSAWKAGPDLPRSVVENLDLYRRLQIVEREFGDVGPPVYGGDEDGLTVRMSSCWHFRLTPLGLAVRQHLLPQGDGENG